MKTKLLNRSFYWLAYIFLAFIFAFSLIISYNSLTLAFPELAVAITFDLTLTAPLLYLFLIWKTRIPNTTVVPFFVLTVIIASFIIPAEQQDYLTFIKKWMIPIVEIGVLSFIGFTVYKTVKAYKSVEDKDADILNALSEVSEKIIGIPALAKVASFEVAVLYYSFLKWRKPTLTDKTFTYHKNSGKLVFYGAVIFIIGIETVVIHVLLAQWNEIVAWVLTLSSLYILLQLFAHLKAIYLRPIEIIGSKLHVRYGLFSGTEIDLENIKEVKFSTTKQEKMEDVKQVALIDDIEQFNTKIHLKEKAEFFGIYGKKDEYKTLLLFVDETEKFNETLKINNDDN